MPPAPTHPISFPEELPISARVRDIAQAIHDHPVVIVAGETGSGKTTQLPKICLAMGRGLRAHIACTQPRRIAATSVAARVAQELGVELGREIGYKIRFAERVSRDTYVKFVTDGILLAELQGDRMLRGYDTIIVDEAHERSVNIDFLLGYLKQLVGKRPDLRVIISSATLDTEHFSKFFDGAPVIEVSGRSYPVEVVYAPPAENVELADSVVQVIEDITQLDSRPDVLVFLPGEREIREAMEALSARALPHTVLLPLYGRLPQAEQQRVFQTLPQRRIVLATNVAETSLTIPGIVYVVDAGLARVNRYNPRTGITQLLVEPISRASADQRKGRAGRLRSGVCFRLYDEQEYANREAHTSPEVQRIGLAGVILQMKVLGLGRADTFAFMDPPSKRAIEEGYRVLEELCALDEQGEPNEVGYQLARLPLDPRLGRMVLAAQKEGSLREVLILVAALSVQDPRERPLAMQKHADERHRLFREETSDFLGLLKLWDWYQQARARLTNNQLRKLCREQFISFVRMKEWTEIHAQLLERCAEMGVRPGMQSAKSEAIHRALLAGLLGRIGMWQPEKKSYVGARQTRFVLHPSSALAKKPPPWVVAAEIVETSQTFARTVAAIDPAWAESISSELDDERSGPRARTLCKRSYSDPHWEQRAAQVVAKEQVTLFGLPIVRDRRVHYGPIAPQVARSIFLMHALVRQQYASRAPFVEHNRAVLEQASRLRDRARRSDMMLDEYALQQFFDQRIPDDVYSGKTFEQWRKQAEADNPDVLKLTLADVLCGDASDLSPERFPDQLKLYGAKLALTYRFDPSEDDDGITMDMPLTVLAQADPDVLEWTIPGWHEEKILLLLQSLPKAERKKIVPIPDVAREIARAHKPFEAPMLAAMSDDIFALAGVRIARDAWAVESLPPHLRFYFRIVSSDGKVIGEGRDLRELKNRFGARARQSWGQTVRASWEREGLKAWTFESVPERVDVRLAGGAAAGYPAIVDTGETVALRVLPSQQEAQQAMRAGLRRLFLLHLGDPLARLERLLPTSLPLTALAKFTGATPSQMRQQMVERAIEEVFGLGEPARFPRDKKTFMTRLDQGRVQLGPQLKQMGALAQELGSSLLKIESMLKERRIARAARDDISSQLQALLPPGVFQKLPGERLAHLPRYLKAIQIRLERLPIDPRRDADKAAQVTPLWQSYVEQSERIRARGVPAEEVEHFRWLLEELRVSLFAPELKTAVPVSSQKLAQHWKVVCQQ